MGKYSKKLKSSFGSTFFSSFFFLSNYGNLETMKKKLSKSAQILRGFTKSKKKPMLKISAVYLIWKAEIPIHYTTWGQVEQAL